MTLQRDSGPHEQARAAVWRSYLFVPGNRPDRFEKACATRAHAVIVDLEDAVPPDDKANARAALADWIDPARPVLVRVNGADTEWFDDDARVCADGGVRGILLPKAERADDVGRIATACPGRPVFPMIETAVGLWSALAIAKASQVRALMLGSLDLQADIGASDDDLLYARSRMVVASRVAAIESPIDGVTQAIGDIELLRRDTLRSRQLGFGGKLCIHPNQVDIVNGCFLPNDEEVAWARRVVIAFAQARGNAVRVDGRMVDRPVLLKAQAILAERDTGAAS